MRPLPRTAYREDGRDYRMNEIQEKRRTLQQTMTFATALAYAIEQLVGKSANGMTFAAGRKLGKRFSEKAKRTEDVEEALAEVKRVLVENHCLWEFETFKAKDQPEMVTSTGDKRELKLVFRDCMIRQALFCYGHEQKGSLCTMMYGFFSGAIENIMGKKSELEIVHAGQNACLKCLRIAG